MLRVYNSPIFAKKGTKIPSRFDKLVERINFAKQNDDMRMWRNWQPRKTQDLMT